VKNSTDHTPKPLLPCSVPQLQPHLDSPPHHLLRDEQRPARRRRVFRVESVLHVAVEERRLANTRTAHDNNLGVDAVLDDEGLHGGGPP